jgi:hypothetical protein
MRLARTLYPDLRGKELSLAFSEGTGGPVSGPTDVRSLLVTIDKAQWHPPTAEMQTKAALGTPIVQNDGPALPLYLRFSFIDFRKTNSHAVGNELTCRPQSFMNSLPSTGLREAERTINTHPEWTDAEMLTEARRLGLKFGPSDETSVVRLVPLKQLNSFYGSLRIKNAKFELYGTAVKCSGCSFAHLRWYIEAEETGTSRILGISIDPFTGEITAIGESDSKER